MEQQAVERPPPTWSRAHSGRGMDQNDGTVGTARTENVLRTRKSSIAPLDKPIKIDLPVNSRNSPRKSVSRTPSAFLQVPLPKPLQSHSSDTRAVSTESQQQQQQQQIGPPPPVLHHARGLRSTSSDCVNSPNWQISAVQEPSGWVQFGKGDSGKTASELIRRTHSHKHSKSFGDVGLNSGSAGGEVNKVAHRRVLSADQTSTSGGESVVDEFSQLALSRTISKEDRPIVDIDGLYDNFLEDATKAEPDLIWIEERQWLKDTPDPNPCPPHQLPAGLPIQPGFGQYAVAGGQHIAGTPHTMHAPNTPQRTGSLNSTPVSSTHSQNPFLQQGSNPFALQDRLVPGQMYETYPSVQTSMGIH